jgi:CTP synthase (UTP-ammonia lyase)
VHEGGLQIVGRDADGEPRLFTIPAHPFFVATLFVPSLTSTPERPHPLITAFLRAAAGMRATTR